VISAVLASSMLKERITPLRIASLGIGLIGVVLLSVGDLHQASFAQMRFILGNVLIFGACLGSIFRQRLLQGFDAEVQRN
jgi:drug/metabolite transporter (DMT)-like permease